MIRPHCGARLVGSCHVARGGSAASAGRVRRPRVDLHRPCSCACHSASDHASLGAPPGRLRIRHVPVGPSSLLTASDQLEGVLAPPDRLLIDGGVLTRLREDDANDIAAAVRVSLTHLAPWMPWATDTAADPATQRARIREAVRAWDAGSDYGYVLRAVDGGPVLGMFGLHRRIGLAALEIGYWLHPSHLGRGYATKAVGALTAAALDLDDIDRVEIHTDPAN